jgi:DNA-binding NarL/FixJ family response regulator
MSETLLVTEINAETGETIERELTAEEIVEREISQAEYETKQAEAQAKASARESALIKLAALGLTQDEIGAL